MVSRVAEYATRGWGLTYAWDAYQDGSVNPESTAYAITTALVLQAFLDAGRIGPQERAIADAWARCCFSDGFYWYSDQPPDAIYTPNVSAMMAAVMFRLGYTEQADAAIARLVGDGPLWRYSDFNDTPNDALHHLYTIWGIEAYRHAGGTVPVPWTADEALAATPDATDVWPVAAAALRSAFARCFSGQTTPMHLPEPASRRDAAHAVYAAAAC